MVTTIDPLTHLATVSNTPRPIGKAPERAGRRWDSDADFSARLDRSGRADKRLLIAAAAGLIVAACGSSSTSSGGGGGSQDRQRRPRHLRRALLLHRHAGRPRPGDAAGLADRPEGDQRAGGVLGKQLDISHADTQCDEADSVPAVRQLLAARAPRDHRPGDPGDRRRGADRQRAKIPTEFQGGSTALRQEHQPIPLARQPLRLAAGRRDGALRPQEGLQEGGAALLLGHRRADLRQADHARPSRSWATASSPTSPSHLTRPRTAPRSADHRRPPGRHLHPDRRRDRGCRVPELQGARQPRHPDRWHRCDRRGRLPQGGDLPGRARPSHLRVRHQCHRAGRGQLRQATSPPSSAPTPSRWPTPTTRTTPWSASRSRSGGRHHRRTGGDRQHEGRHQPARDDLRLLRRLPEAASRRATRSSTRGPAGTSSTTSTTTSSVPTAPSRLTPRSGQEHQVQLLSASELAAATP